MPVLNEERHLEAAVRRVLEQEYPGELEVILSIGPSKDRTHEIAAELSAADPRVRVVDNPAARTPSALNLGIARGPPRHHRPGRRSRRADRRLHRAGRRAAGRDRGGQRRRRDGRPGHDGRSSRRSPPRTRPGSGSAAPPSTWPSRRPGRPRRSSSGVFQKEALLALGGFDETMHRAQDWELNYRLRKSGRRIWFSPDLRVTYRPRSSFRALVKQMYETGRWRREVVRRYPDTASARYLAPPVAVVGIVGRAGERPGGPGHRDPGCCRPASPPRRLRRAGRRRLRGRTPPLPLRDAPAAAAAGARRTHMAWGAGFPGRLRELLLAPSGPAYRATRDFDIMS